MKKNITNTYKLILASCFGVVLVLLACKKYPDYVGPKYQTAGEGFKADSFTVSTNGANSNSIDFTSSGVVSFKAQFNQPVSWTLVIRGERSGAYREFSGLSSKLDATNSTWKGGHNGIFFFKRNERCFAELSFLGTKYVVRDTFTVTRPKNFNNIAEGVNLINTADFEDTVGANRPLQFPAQFSFLESATNLAALPEAYKSLSALYIGKSAVVTIKNSNVDKMVEGNRCFSMSGVPDSVGKGKCDATFYFAGAVQHRYYNRGGFLTTWSNPEDIWLNIYLYGDDTTMNSLVSFQFHETDATNDKLKPATTLNGSITQAQRDTIRIYQRSGPLQEFCNARVQENEVTVSQFGRFGYTLRNRHDPASDDSWEISIRPDTKGWKLYSFRLSDLNAAIVAGSGGSGNKIKEPTRICRVQLALIASSPRVFSKMIFDYPTITLGGPFDPSKY